VLAAVDSAVRALHVTRRVTPLQLQLLALPLAALQQCRQSSMKPAAAAHDTAAAAQQQQQQQQLVTEIETGTGDAPVTVTLIAVTATGTVRNGNRSAPHRCHGVLMTDGVTAACLALTHALTHAATLALMHAVIHAVTHADHRTMTEAVLLLVVAAVRSSSNSSSSEGACTAQQEVTRIAVRVDLLAVQHSHSHSSSLCLQGDAKMMIVVVLDSSSSSSSTTQAVDCSSYNCRAVETETKSVLVVTEAVIEIVSAAGMLVTKYTEALAL
jgi:hypothetical protein